MQLDKRIDKFAELAVKVGINVQPGETMLIRVDVEARDFARRCVREAYKAGAKHVYVEYSDEINTREKYLSAPDAAFDEYPEWQSHKYTQIAKEGGSFLTIVSNNPDLMKGVDPDRIGRAQKVASGYLKEWRSYTLSDKCKWSIVAVPSEAWAKRVHPELPLDEAVENLWTEILDCTRVTEDPIAEWKRHNENLDKKTKMLNEMNFKTLKYKSSKTDLEIGLPEGHIWLSGSSKDEKGVDFNANMPTEEIFGMPHKYRVDGVVHSTKPLVYSGSIINDFWIKFENGKIVDYDAKEGKEYLKNLVETDEGSVRIGEVALVPYDSPISNKNIIFYTTLFDENASCHLAIGAAYTSCIENGDELSEEEKDAKGVNTSLTHVDFMVGDSDLDIMGIKQDGSEFKIFENGNWAF